MMFLTTMTSPQHSIELLAVNRTDEPFSTPFALQAKATNSVRRLCDTESQASKAMSVVPWS